MKVASYAWRDSWTYYKPLREIMLRLIKDDIIADVHVYAITTVSVINQIYFGEDIWVC